MLGVTITTTEYRELIRKATIHDIKKRELEGSSYVSPEDRILFDIPEPKHEPKGEPKTNTDLPIINDLSGKYITVATDDDF